MIRNNSRNYECFNISKKIKKQNILKVCGNDPSAGSPTETLLRLHLPLNDEV